MLQDSARSPTSRCQQFGSCPKRHRPFHDTADARIELAGGDTALGVGLLGINLGLQVLLLLVYVWMFEGRSGVLGPVIELPLLVLMVRVLRSHRLRPSDTAP